MGRSVLVARWHPLADGGDALFRRLDHHARLFGADAGRALTDDGRARGSRRDAPVRHQHGFHLCRDASVLANHDPPFSALSHCADSESSCPERRGTKRVLTVSQAAPVLTTCPPRTRRTSGISEMPMYGETESFSVDEVEGCQVASPTNVSPVSPSRLAPTRLQTRESGGQYAFQFKIRAATFPQGVQK